MSLATKMFVTPAILQKHSIFQHSKVSLQRNWRVRWTIINGFRLQNQKFRANITIIEFDLVWEGKYVSSFNFIDTIENFLASISPTFTCNLTPYIKLPAYERITCWSAESILMSLWIDSMKSVLSSRLVILAN